jgi:hypothetical protein
MKDTKNTPLTIGKRVRISANYSWAQGATGIISTPPDVIYSRNEWVEGCYRELETPRGRKRFYWIKFDHPHFDADDDGPYEEAEIEHSYIEPSE